MEDKNNQVIAKRRRKGQGSISKKENGTYLGRISVAGYEPFSCTGSSRKEVEKKLQEFRTRTLRQEVIPRREMVNDYIERWLVYVKKPSLKPSSYDRLERTFENHIRDSTVGRCQMGNIAAIDVQKLINEKSETMSYSTIKKVYGLLNSCFQYAVINRELDFNPMLAVHLPKEENMKKQTKAMSIFTEEELEKIEMAAKITYQSGEVRYRHAWFFILLANTGLRAGEAIALTWENVDLERGLIHVRQNASCVRDREGISGGKYKTILTTVKTKSGNRTVPCNEKAMEALLWMKEYQEAHSIRSPYVDCNDKGEILKQQTLPKILKAVLSAAEVPYKNVHSFRHTFASNLIRAGVDVKVVSQLLGHASVKVTYDTYVHMGIDSAIEAVNLLNRDKG